MGKKIKPLTKKEILTRRVVQAQKTRALTREALDESESSEESDGNSDSFSSASSDESSHSSVSGSDLSSDVSSGSSDPSESSISGSDLSSDPSESSECEFLFVSVYAYDNADRLVRVERRQCSTTGRLVALETSRYDNRNRVFDRVRFSVDPTTGVVGEALHDLTWYDPVGNVIKHRGLTGQGFEKMKYDGLGRVICTYVACAPGSQSYAQAASVTDDWVLQQTEMVLDGADNILFQRTRERNHDAIGTGSLQEPFSAQRGARVSYQAMFPDAVGRVVAMADFGTNGGIEPDPPLTIPPATDTCLVSLTRYNNRGEANEAINPRGIVTRQEFDDAGQLVKTIENYEPEPEP